MPFPYKRILCPVDFDDYSRSALEHAAALAESGQGTLYVLHAVRINPLVAQGLTEGPAAPEMLDSQEQFASTQIEQMLAGLPSQVTPQVMIEVGDPGVCITDAAIKVDADLVVIATHGRRGLMHLVLGSVAEKVVRESPAPVLTVRSPETPK